MACTKYNFSFFPILGASIHRFTHFFVTSSSFFGGERKHSHFPKLKNEKVKILTSPSSFADICTKIKIMENILHAFSLIKTEPEVKMVASGFSELQIDGWSLFTANLNNEERFAYFYWIQTSQTEFSLALTFDTAIKKNLFILSEDTIIFVIV